MTDHPEHDVSRTGSASPERTDEMTDQLISITVPDEPPIGAVAIDDGGRAWQRGGGGSWLRAGAGVLGTTMSWPSLLLCQGPIRVVWSPPPAAPAAEPSPVSADNETATESRQ